MANNGHWKVWATMKDGGPASRFVISVTPSDWRYEQNLAATLKRAARRQHHNRENM
jgi:hypothetical protein